MPEIMNGDSIQGLTTEEARKRLQEEGTNAVPDVAVNPLRAALSKFWAPVPWLLECAIVLQFLLHKYVEAWVIAGLLVFNAVLSYFQEGRAKATLQALKARLALSSSVLRDGRWSTIDVTRLVRDDIVKLSLGAVVPADVRVLEGDVALDQAALTGESLPVEATKGNVTFAGALVTRGEATAVVTATGVHTKFGKTAELVRTAHAVSSQQRAVLRIVRNLAIFNACVIAAMAIYSVAHAMPLTEILTLLLSALLAAIPVALPATFTLAAAVGAQSLAKLGVLPTRLSAIDEAATIDVLCSDKTGTLTCNELAVSEVIPDDGLSKATVLGWAALASSDGGSDVVDGAVRKATAQTPAQGLPIRATFTPFDPAKKYSQATAVDAAGVTTLVVKGAFAIITSSASCSTTLHRTANGLQQQGFRVLAVAKGKPNALAVVGLLALSDPPREDSRILISQLCDLGVRTVMVTGDAAVTAGVIAREVGLDGPICPDSAPPQTVQPSDYAVFAGILPEGKYDLVCAFQKNGHTAGMCGDGANDAPALRQAQMGIAVSTATDVAKSAAGIVLTKAGLAGVVAAVSEGRIAFQRILTYTLNSVIKKITEVLLLAFGLVLTGHAILTPMLMVFLMVTGDFLSMALTTDRVSPSSIPNQWRIGKITVGGIVLGVLFLGFCSSLLVLGFYQLHLNIASLRTLSVVAIVFGTQAMIYAIRDRRSFWGQRPTSWLVASSIADIGIVSAFALRGFAMQAISARLLALEFGAAILFWLVMAAVKRPLFHKLQLA